MRQKWGAPGEHLEAVSLISRLRDKPQTESDFYFGANVGTRDGDTCPESGQLLFQTAQNRDAQKHAARIRR